MWEGEMEGRVGGWVGRECEEEGECEEERVGGWVGGEEERVGGWVGRKKEWVGGWGGRKNEWGEVVRKGRENEGERETIRRSMPLHVKQ